MGRTELISRLNANECEYCGQVGGYMEVHHIRKMFDVEGKKQMWQKIMSAMRRKTLVLCVDCHQQLHTTDGLPNWRALTKKYCGKPDESKGSRPVWRGEECVA